MASERDPRDSRTDAVQKLVDRAFDDASKRGAIAQLLFGDHPVGGPHGGWPIPTLTSREYARRACVAAADAARTSLKHQRVRVLYTRLREAAELRVAWQPLTAEQELPPAPLLWCLADERAQRIIASLASYVFTDHTRKLWDFEVRAQLMRRLNAFAQVEINLWSFASQAGHRQPPPYAVRYDLARWLWHPSIAGTILCLRCGTELRYTRAERKEADDRPGEIHARTGRCRSCARGPAGTWPDHAIEPYGRGTWLLRCSHSECAHPFIGRPQARYCATHRLNRITRARRQRSRSAEL